MTMLPDIDEQTWDDYDRQRLAQELEQKQQQFALQQTLTDQISQVGAIGAMPEQAPAPPDLSRIGGWATAPAPAPAPVAEPEPPQTAPEPAPASAPPPQLPSPPADALDRVQRSEPAPSPVPAPTAAPSAQAQPDLSSWYDQIWQQGVSSAAQAGGDVQKFSDELWNRLQSGASNADEAFSHGLSAANSAGVDLQSFANSFSPSAPPAPEPEITQVSAPGAAAAAVGSVPEWLTTLIAKNAPQLANDPDFIRTVAAGAKAESGWDPDRVQNGFQMGSGAGARGLFQFDMGGMGKGYNEQDLLGQSGAELQASQIVPLYAKAYQSAPQGLSGAEKASWVAAQAERPAGFTDPSSSARRNYASAYNEIGGANAPGAREALARVGSGLEQNVGADYVFPVANYQGKVEDHWGSVLGGSDLFAARGTPVQAMRGGKVIESGYNAVGGNSVLIQGDDGLQYYYAHGNEAPSVKVGQVVGAGTYLMPVGDTGDAKGTGTHLHIGIGPDIKLGADKYGGTGGDYDAVGLLRNALAGKASQGALPTDTAAGPVAIARPASLPEEPSSYYYTPPEPTMTTAHVNQSQPVDDSMIVAHAPVAVEEAPQSPIDRLKSAFSDFIDSVGGAKDQAASALSQVPDVSAAGLVGAGASNQAAVQDASQIGAAAAQSAQERVQGIESPQTGNPLLDALGTGASVAGTGLKTAFDVANEAMPTTQLARVYEGLSGDIRRDPQINNLLGVQEVLQAQLYGASTAAEQDAIRQHIRDTQAAIEARKAEVASGSGVTDLESAYRAGLASPDRANAELVGGLAALPLAGIAGAEEAPAIARTAARAFDPLSTAISGAGAARQAGAASPGAALRLAGAVGGGAVGYETTPEDASLQERLLRTGGGALAGLGLGEAAVRGAGAFRPTIAEKASTAFPGLNTVLDMHSAIDNEPSKAAQIAERVQQFIGTGGRTGDIDTAAADKYAYINQMTGRARQDLGAAFTPEVDAEAAVATYPGRGARAKQLIDDQIVPALQVARKELGQTQGDQYLNAYRKLQRDLEVANLYGGAREASAGIKNAADAQARLAELEQTVGPDGWKALQRADQMLNDATRELLLRRVDSGLVDPDLAARLIAEQPHYNPTVFMKYLDEGATGAPSGGNRFVTNSNLLRRLAEEGGADDTEKPLTALTRHFAQNEVLINRNDVGRTILEAAKNDPVLVDSTGKSLIQKVNPMRAVTGPEIAGPGGPAKGAPGDISTILQRFAGDQKGLVSVYEDGKRVYYSVPPELEKLMKGLEGQNPGDLGKIFQALNAPLRWGATAASPPFLVTNAIADAITTFVREGAKTTANIPRGWWAAATKNDLYKDYIRAGGGMESLFQRSPQEMDKLIEDTGGLVVRNQSDLDRLVKDALQLQFIRRAGEVIEQGPHLAAFEQHLKAGESAAQAATAGRRATVDFQRSGDVLQQANLASLFLNARVQGGLNIARSLRDDPIAKYRLAGVAAVTAANNARNRQMPEYWDVPEYERKQNAVIMLPGATKNDNGIGYKSIPRISLPLRELSAFTDPLNYALSQFDTNPAAKDPRSLQDVGLDTLGTLSPISGNDPGAASASLMPAPLRTPVELLANRRFYTGLPIVPQDYQGLPPSQQYNDRTSVLSRKLGETLGISPMQLDFIINENLGTLGRTGLGAIDTVTGKPAAEGLAGWPVIGGLSSGVVRNYGGQLAADKYNKLDQLMGQFQELIARSIRQMPEYATATRDSQDDMLRAAELHLRETLADELNIPATTKDRGLPDKYVGVSDPQQAADIDRAVSRLNAWSSDPVHAPKPSDEEVKLAVRYKDAVSPYYRFQSRQSEARQREVRKQVEEQLAGIRGQ